MKIILSFLTIFVLSACVVAQQKKIVCQVSPEIPTSQIDVNICTHLIYCSLGVDQNGGITNVNYNESVTSNYLTKATQMKTENPKLNVIVAFGGWNDDLLNAWSNIAANSTARNNFTKNVFDFIQRFNLSGIDIDWEYPTSADKENFILLLKTIKNRLGTQYSLSITIGAGIWRTGISYDVIPMFAIVDFVNLMTFYMHGPWEKKTGLHSALYRGPTDNTAQNVDESVKLLLNYEVDKMKIIVGVSTFGAAFNLSYASHNGVGAPAIGLPSIGYRDICQRVKSFEFKYNYEKVQKTPYVISGRLWVGYDNVRSVTEKAKYINKNGLGGAMFSVIKNDDYEGKCGEGKFPLVSTVSRIVLGNSTTMTTTTTKTTRAP